MPSDNLPPDGALEVREVSKFFGDVTALKRVSLRIERGESVLLYGPNGAGKTTLLRIMAALSRPSEGQVFLKDEELARHPVGIRSEIGFLSHSTFLYGELTAAENLRFAGALFGLRQRDEKVERALEVFGLRDRSDVPVRELSRGLQQRVALARVILHQPTYILLDEPFTGLDAETSAGLQDFLRGLPGEGKALVFSTHQFEQGAAIARRLVLLERGGVRYDGPVNLAPLAALGIAR